jgi:hypothetical protein
VIPLSIIAFVIVAVLIGLLILALQRSRRRSRPVEFNLPQTHGSVSAETERHLLRLMNGDRTAALRLVAQAKQRNPGRSEQWCWEKVIYDLERDR